MKCGRGHAGLKNSVNIAPLSGTELAVSPGLPEATGQLPIFLLLHQFSMKKYCLCHLQVELLFPHSDSLWLACPAAAFLGERLPVHVLPALLIFGCSLWAGESSHLSRASSRFIGHPGLQSLKVCLDLLIPELPRNNKSES